MRFLRQKRLISFLLYYYHGHPDQLSLDHHHSFSVVSPLPFRPTNNNHLLDKYQQTNRYTRGAHNRMHSSVYRWMGLQLAGGGNISGSLRYVIGLDLRVEVTVNGE